MFRDIKIAYPEHLRYSTPGKTIRLYCENRLPGTIAGWMLVTSLKHPLRAIYGSDVRAAWNLLLDAIIELIRGKWMDFRFAHDLLTQEERKIKAEMEAENVER